MYFPETNGNTIETSLKETTWKNKQEKSWKNKEHTENYRFERPRHKNTGPVTTSKTKLLGLSDHVSKHRLLGPSDLIVYKR